MKYFVVALLALSASAQSTPGVGQQSSVGLYTSIRDGESDRMVEGSTDHYSVINNKIYMKGCKIPLPTTQKQLDIELDYFSRYFDKQYYFSAIAIYNELKK
tara:strand:+ start:77 stop:379 length:303 start_codon:yes stop_codon:yes gene_type:complete